MYKIFKNSLAFFNGNLRKPLNFPKFALPISLFHCLGRNLATDSKLEFVLNEVEQLQFSKPKSRISPLTSEIENISNQEAPQNQKAEESAVHISHPWPEWVDLMECLLKRGYFDELENPFGNIELGAKESKLIRTACLNFGRDRYNLIRFLSRKDIQVTVGCGCPSLDRKVVNSGKRLRGYMGIDEGNVCSSCSLRGDCERAFVKAREDEGGRTVDVMRIVLTYGLDPIIGSVENKPCLNKMVKESVRRLLKEIVRHGIEEEDTNLPDTRKVAIRQVNSNPQGKGKIEVPRKQGDWVCPKCNFLNFARNIKCLQCDGLNEERIRQMREDQDHLPLKKGDWICNECNFLNFAKNTRCLLCKEKPPKRHLNPGEWECESCNYINFRRNMVCLKCDHRRPKASNTSESSAQPHPEDKDHHKSSKLNFVRHNRDFNDQSYMMVDKKNKNGGSDTWRFVENTSEKDNQLNSWNDSSPFMNFPIAGSKTQWSKNAQNREEWKKEMLKRSKGSVETSESDDEFWSTNDRNAKEIFDITDDEEMAEWFGSGKNGRNKSPTSK